MRKPARGRRVALVAVLLGGTLAACSVLDGLDADYKLQSNVPGEGGADALATSDGSSLEAGDAFVGDAGFDGDAGRFCDEHGDAANVVFCWDFEDSLGTPTLGFDSFEEYEGSYFVENGMGTFGSRGLRSTVQRPPISGRVYVRKEITPDFQTMSHHQLSFAFTIRTLSTLYTGTLGALGYGSKTALLGISVYANMGKNGIDIGNPPGDLAGLYASPDVGEWRRATIAMDRTVDGGPYTTTMTVSLLDNSSPIIVDSARSFDAGAGPTQLLVGTFFTSDDDGGVETVIDDVLYTQIK